MQNGQNKFSLCKIYLAAAVLLQISVVLFPKVPSLTPVFLFPLRVFASGFLVFFLSQCQILFHQRKSDGLTLQGESLLERVSRLVMPIKKIQTRVTSL